MQIVEGKIAVKAVLNSKYRKVNKIIIAENKNNKDIDYIIEQAKKKKITVERVGGNVISELASGKTHGGIIADVTVRKMQTVISLIKKERPFLALLEGIEDSYNLGYIFRSLYAFGCDGVIMPQHYVDYDDGNLLKSSAGASELLPIVWYDDLPEILQVLKGKNISVISAYRGNQSVSLYEYDFKDKGVIIAIGGAMRGLSQDVLSCSDDFIHIPYANDFRNSLNAASAASVIASEIYRQNNRRD